MKEELEKKMNEEIKQLEGDIVKNYELWLYRAGVCFLMNEPELRQRKR